MRMAEASSLQGVFAAYLSRMNLLETPTLGPRDTKKREATEEDSKFLANSIRDVKNSQRPLFMACIVVIGIILLVQLGTLFWAVSLSGTASKVLLIGSMASLWLPISALRRLWMDSIAIDLLEGVLPQLTPAQTAKVIERILWSRFGGKSGR